jgi:N-acetyl-gamma-glutamylphosphate reductase
VIGVKTGISGAGRGSADSKSGYAESNENLLPHVLLKHVHMSDKPPRTKWATGSNLALVSYAADPERILVIAIGVVDNLDKGAAGQAVQNANLMCGLPETAD